MCAYSSALKTRNEARAKEMQQGPCGDGGGTGGDKLPTTHGQGGRHGGRCQRNTENQPVASLQMKQNYSSHCTQTGNYLMLCPERLRLPRYPQAVTRCQKSKCTSGSKICVSISQSLEKNVRRALEKMGRQQTRLQQEYKPTNRDGEEESA